MTFATTANIESPQTVKISPRVAEQITTITVKEGDPVRAGQVLIQLDDTQLAAAVRKEQALLAEGQAKLLQTQVTENSVLTPLETQIRQNQAGLASSRANYNQVRESYIQQVAAADAAVADAQSKVAGAQAATANAQAGLLSAQANQENDTTQLTRETSLFNQGAVAKQDVDNARTTAAVQNANVGVAQAQIKVAQASLQSALSELKAAQEQDTITRAKGPSDIEAARTTFVQAQAQLKNANANTDQRAAYQATLAGLRADVLSDEGPISPRLRHQLAETIVRSPIDGFVSSRLADPGTLASPGTAILNLQALSTVWVNIPIPQEQIGEVAAGQSATITVDTLPGQAFTGRVFEIDPSADPASRNFTVRVSLSNPNKALKPGMFARVILVTQHVRSATVVPLEAIQKDDAGTFVWTLAADSTVHRLPVVTGASDDNGIDYRLRPSTGSESGDRECRTSQRRGGGRPRRHWGTWGSRRRSWRSSPQAFKLESQRNESRPRICSAPCRRRYADRCPGTARRSLFDTAARGPAAQCVDPDSLGDYTVAECRPRRDRVAGDPAYRGSGFRRAQCRDSPVYLQ